MKQSITILFIILTNSGIGYSIVSPLFPLLGDEDKLSDTILGLIISTFPFFGFIATPFYPKLCKKYNRISLLYIGTIGEATCTFLYGLLPIISNRFFLLLIIFILRAIHGISSGLIGTLVYSSVSIISEPGEVQLNLGHLEVAWFTGLSGGPLIASILFYFGGFSLPFIILGLLLYISVYLAYLIKGEKIEIDDNNEESHQPFFRFMFYADIALILGSMFIAVLVTTFYLPSLLNHLIENFGLSVSVACLFFIAGMIIYIFLLQFLKIITNNFGMHGATCLGLFMAAFGCLFIYPIPPIPKTFINVLFGLCITGGAGGPIYVPGLLNLSKYIKNHDPNIDNFIANDIASSMYTFINNVGDFVSPALGGSISSNLGFKYTCLIISIAIFLYLALFIYFFRNIIKEEILAKRENIQLTEIKKEFDIFPIEDTINLNQSLNIYNLQVRDLLCCRTSYLRRNNSSLKKKSKHETSTVSILSYLTK